MVLKHWSVLQTVLTADQISLFVQFGGDPFGGGGGFGGEMDFQEIMRMMQEQQAAGGSEQDIFGSFFGVSLPCRQISLQLSPPPWLCHRARMSTTMTLPTVSALKLSKIVHAVGLRSGH